MLRCGVMKLLSLAIFVSVAVSSVWAQSDLQKIVDAEHSFARLAAEKGTKEAFLANMTADALIFNPDKVNAREFWTARPASASLLSWAPNYADVSANGILGYTTGNWEFRAKGKDDQPSAFGEFITIWQRQPDGKYKWMVDIGVGHKKPARYSSDWVTSAESKDTNAKNSSAADSANVFFEAAVNESAKKAYGEYAADDIRLYRENKLPFIGKKEAMRAVSLEKGQLILSKRSSFFGSADLSYTVSTYMRKVEGTVVEKGNFMQIWKLKSGRWQIVLDIFKPVPEK